MSQRFAKRTRAVRALVQRSSHLGIFASLVLLSACGGDDGTIEGTVELRIATLDDGTKQTLYRLELDGARPVELVADPAALAQLESGDRVALRGRHDVSRGRARFIAESVDLVASGIATLAQPIAPAAGTTNQFRLAALLVHWSSPDEMTVEDMRSRLFSGETSTAAYYWESSYQVHDLTGDVFGWYQMSNPGGCDEEAIAEGAENAAAAAGVDLESFDQVLYYFPQTDQCQWSGLGAVGSPTNPSGGSWYNGSAGCVVLAQEIGHNYGLAHSRLCMNLPEGMECSEFDEYGDMFCPLGRGCYQMNAVQKGLMGWYSGCNIVTAGASASFELQPFETPSEGLQALRVPRGEGRFFYIENRQPLGLFDIVRSGGQSSAQNSVFEGVLIHEGPEVQPFPRRNEPRNPYLIDVTPEDDQRDSSLKLNESYTSPEGIVIEVTAKTETTATVSITTPTGSGDPTCMDGTVYDGDTPATSGGAGGMAGAAGAGGMGGTGGGTLQDCSELEEWVAGTTETNVQHGGSAYRCTNPSACSSFVQVGVYEPGVGSGWTNAWELLGSCMGAGQGGAAGTAGFGGANAGGMAGAATGGLAGAGGLAGGGTAGASAAGTAGTVGTSGASGAVGTNAGASGAATAAGGAAAGTAGANAGAPPTAPGPTTSLDEGGCGCRVTGAGSSNAHARSMLALLGLGLLLARRARRDFIGQRER